ncbi:MAG: ABC transporter permease [Thioalkalivibrionaceae bacterium]
MLTYLVRRVLWMIPTLLGITLVVFVVMAASPGGITVATLVDGQNLEPEAKQALESYYNRLYGLDQPPPVQYLRWLNNISPVGFRVDESGAFDWRPIVKAPDLGLSFRYGRPVTDLLAERLPITLLLNALSIPLIYVFSIAIGVRAATHRGEDFDRQSSVVLLALWSAPTMLVGVLLIGFFASDQFWQWFPTGGLSRREALDATFLPIVGAPWMFLALLIGPVLGAVLGGWAAAHAPRVARRLAAIGLGALGGLAFVGALDGITSHAGGVFAMGVAAALLAWLGDRLAVSDWRALRVLIGGLLGFALGLALVIALLPGDVGRGFLIDRVWHLILPVLALSYGGLAFLAKLARSSVLENLSADYARTARAKGVPEDEVLWRHVFRNSLLPLITVSATLLPSLLAGSVIVEAIFSIDGMGKLAIEAVQTRDRELVLAVALLSGVLTLVGYLLADVAYAIADPRVSYD